MTKDNEELPLQEVHVIALVEYLEDYAHFLLEDAEQLHARLDVCLAARTGATTKAGYCCELMHMIAFLNQILQDQLQRSLFQRLLHESGGA